MKKAKLKVFLFFIVFVAFLSCISKKNNLTNENFEFISGNEKITFEISTGNKYLEENVSTITKFKFENINTKSVSLSGKTIRFIKGNLENELLIEISPKKEDLEKGKLKIFVSYKSGGVIKSFVLKIPVKY
ncbi:hypothetical protein AR687_16040 [Flavobacteriaceae bacterium CRH]|nr:hypothetical protein AR687_16040 [Flavobacteriaceae bacterium CRH]